MIATSLPAMKSRLLTLLFAALALSTLTAAPAVKPEPLPTVTTVKRSAIQVGSSSFALVKGTKLEMIGREGKMLLVKYRTSQGKIPYADTDYVLPEGEETDEAAVEEPPAAPVKKVATPATKPTQPAPAALPAVAKQTAGQIPGGQQPTTVPPPPALSLDQKPTSTYGKMVQKAKQAEQAHNDKLVKPADEILDEKPKK